jgi:hypothetical protein
MADRLRRAAAFEKSPTRFLIGQSGASRGAAGFSWCSRGCC